MLIIKKKHLTKYIKKRIVAGDLPWQYIFCHLPFSLL